jgi:hypothetical protein
MTTGSSAATVRQIVRRGLSVIFSRLQESDNHSTQRNTPEPSVPNENAFVIGLLLTWMVEEHMGLAARQQARAYAGER